MKNNGFTLVELMIAVVIIAILAGIALPAYNDYVEEARMTSAKSSALSIKPYLEEYFLEKGTYAGWTDSSVDTSNFGGITLEEYSVSPLDYSLTIKLDSSHSYTFTKSQL